MESRPHRHRIDSGRDPLIKRRSAASKRASDWEDGGNVGSIDDGSSDNKAVRTVILIPVFNDWASVAQLLPKLDSVLASHFLTVDVLVVDDGSTVEPDGMLESGVFAALRRVDLLRLRRNLGHQRAIAIGLAYIEDCLSAGAVVVMDGDGEDDPADVPRLLERLEETGDRMIVFAERARRSESLVFRMFYALFKLLHRVPDRPGCTGRQLQRHSAPAALEPGCGGRDLESLRGGRSPIAAATLHDSDPSVQTALR